MCLQHGEVGCSYTGQGLDSFLPNQTTCKQCQGRLYKKVLDSDIRYPWCMDFGSSYKLILKYVVFLKT